MAKFRFWDTKSKVMRIEDFCLQGQSGIIQGKYGEVFEEFIATQSTELKDKNGVEIYEGDIFKRNDHYGKVVRDKSGMWMIEFDDKKIITLIRDIRWDWKVKEQVVVGNIYRNSELLGE